MAGDGGYWGDDGTKGQQFGSGSKPYKTLTLSTSGISGTITKIIINTSGASSVNASFTVSVGGTKWGSSTKLTTEATAYTFTGSNSGEIKFSYTQTSSKALYIKSISVTYETAASHTVTWKVNDETYTTGSPSTSVLGGSKVTQLPTDPDDCSADVVFVGWTESTTFKGTKPSDLFSDVEGSPAINKNTTFHAVFATKTTTGGDISKQYSFDITKGNFNTTSYAANNTSKTSTAKASDNSTKSVSWTSNQVMQQSSTMQWQSSKGYIYNTTDLGNITNITITSTTGTFTTYYGTSQLPSQNTSVGTGNGYFQIKVGSATGKVSNIKVTFTQTVEGETTTTYSDYTTTCTTETSVTLQPNGGTGTAKVLETTDGSLTLPECEFTYEGYRFVGWNTKANGTGTTYQPSAEYTPAENPATLYAKWAKEYTVTYNANGGTTTCEDNNKYIVGEQVTVCISAPTRDSYTFNGWSYSPNVAITDGQFTMPENDVAITAQWTSNKTATSLTWSEDAYSATIDADNDFPALTKSPADLSPIAYSSSDASVATIDANGNITLVAAGTTTITATFKETPTHTGATASYTLTVNPSNCKWVETTTIDDGDEVVITTKMEDVVYALPNNYGTSTPNVVLVDNIKNNEIPSVSNDIKWTIEKQGGQYIFHPNGDLNSWLYCTNSNDGVRVGTNANNTFAIGQNLESITHVATSRSIRIGSTDLGGLVWRCYTTTSDQTLKFYKRECLDASKVWVEGNLANVTCDQMLPQQLAKNGSLTLNFEAATGYALPDNVTVTGTTPSWNKATGTLTISNPTANVTVTIEAVKLHTITWMVGSASVLSEDVANGTGVTQTPASNPEGDAIGDCADTFLGWSEKSAGSTPQDAAYYDNLCSAADMKSKHTSVTGDRTFYAVFATKEGSSETTQMYQLVTSISGGKEYIFATGNSAGSVNGLTCDANSNLTATSLTVKTSSGITYIETPTSNNVVWNITGSSSSYNAQNKGQSGKYLRCYGTSPNAVIAASAYALYWNDSKGLYGKSNSGTTSYYLYYNNSKWGASSNPNGRVYAFEKKEVTVDNTTYSNYVTNCCALASATNLTVSGTTAESATLTWTAPSPTTGITKLQVRDENGNVKVNNLAANATTATITGLKECTSYQYYVVSVGEDCEVVSNTVTATPFSGAKTVNYDYNGGSGSVASFTTNCTNQTITLPDATRPGYTFNGWFDAESGGNRVGAAGAEYNPATSPVTLYAQWIKKIYIISFHANGGEGTMANQSADENDVVAQLNANQFTRDGYAFVGWNTKANGTGIAYADQATDITLTGNLTLYAQWAPVVTLNDAGNEETAHPTAVNGTITLPDGANACSPYEFVGWTTLATGDWNEGINEPTLVPSPYQPTQPTTLYAVYKIQSTGNPNAFKLSFEGDNGKTYYVGEYGSSPYLRGYSNITEADAVMFIRKKMFPNDDTKYYLYLEHLEEYLYCSSGNLYTTSSEPSESQGWVFHTVGDKIQIQAINQDRYLSYADRDDDRINITTHSTGSQESFNMLSAVTSTYVASPLCNQEIEIIFETGNGDFVDNAPATNPLTVSRGDVITLPTCEYPGYEFMGWMKDEQQLDPSDIIGTYYTGDYTVDGVSSTITFYAYYKVIPEEVEFTGKDDVELLMYYYDGTANYYYASSFDGGNGELPSMQNCFNATTWTFTNVGNMQYYIQDETGKYLGAVNDNDNDLSLSNTPKVWNFTLVNGLWKMVCENSPSRALMYISTGKKFANAAISNEGNGAYSYVTLGICPYPTYTTNPVLSQGFSITNTVMVTSASGQKVKAASALTLETRNIELPCTFTISAPNITFYDNTGAEVTQLTSSAASEQFELHFAYKPTAENTIEYPTITITDDEMKTYTIKNRISARSLPATFAIVAKVGNLWYALPSQGLNSTTPPAAYPIEVDDMADPTAVAAVPANADWSLRQVYEASRVDATKDRFVANGENLVFVNNEGAPKALNASASGNYLLTDAQYSGYYETNPGLYEWTPTTSDLETYTLTNAQRKDRTLNVSINNIFGVHSDNKATTEVRFLPITGRYTPAALQVVEWKENSVVIMYNGNPAQTAAVSVNGGAAQETVLSSASAQRDIAVYELTATGLAANRTQRLSITIGTEKVILPIPYIISGEKTDLELLPGATVAARQEIAKVSDLVILKDAKLTADGAQGNPYKFRNVTIYGGGKLVIPSEEKGFGVASLTLRAGGITDAGEYDYVYPQFELRGTFTNSAAKINYDYITDYDHWFHLVLPFDGDLGTIKYPTEFYGANVAVNNTGSWQIKRYAGEIRATGNYNAWKDIETEGKTSTTAGQGYIFWGAPKKVSVNGGASTRQKWGIQRITMSVTADDAETEKTDKILTGLSSHKDVANNSGKDNDQGWNLIGNPYMVNLTDMATTGLHACKLVEVIDPATDKWNGKWEWNDETNIRYLTIPSDHFDTYTAKTVAQSVPLIAGRAFFVQLDGEANGITFAAANRASLMPALLAENNDKPVDIETGIILSNETMQDEVNFWIKDGKTNDYEYNADYPKTPNSTNFNIYGVHTNGDLSWVATSPEYAAQSMPIGYQVPAAGTFTLSVSGTYYSENLQALFVTDHEASPEVTTNLVDEDYTFYVNQAETNNTRFTVSIILKPDKENTPTGVDNINTKANQPIKFLYQDKIYILRNGMIYDTTGKQVITINK